MYDHVLIILAQMRSKTSSCSGEMPSSPWLTIPLEDYEAHMALPVVGQAQMLAEQLVLQLAHAQQHAISPSDYRTLNALSGAFRLVVPADLSALASAAGFEFVNSSGIDLPSGKQFLLQTFELPGQ